MARAKTPQTRTPRNTVTIIPAPDGPAAPDGIAIFEREVLDPVRRDYIQARMLGLGFIADKGMATEAELAKLPGDQSNLERSMPVRFGTGRDRVSTEPQRPYGGRPWAIEGIIAATVIITAGAGIWAGLGWVPFMGFVSGVICTLVAREVSRG